MAKTNDEQLLSIFPKELWDQILDKVEENADLENLTNSSTFFRNCLISKRVNFLFPKVWKLLDVRYLRANEDENFYCRPCQKSHWWYSSLFSIRLVCKTWRETVDECFQSLPGKHTEKLNDDNEFECMIREFDKPLTIPKVIGLLQHFKSTHPPELDVNPFVSRRVFLELGNESQPGDNFVQLIERQYIHLDLLRYLFLKYGHHVWFIDIKLHGERMYSTQDVLEKLSIVLDVLPNLKSLSIKLGPGFGSNGVGQVFLPVNFGNKVFFGPLENLEVLSTSKLSASIFNGLLPSCNNVQVLELNSENLEWYAYHGVSQYNIYTAFPNLRVLIISFWTRDEFDKFKKAKVDWKLEKLRLCFFWCQFINWSEIFDAVNSGKWAKTLTALDIELPRSKHDDYWTKASSSLKLKLPRLKSLKLEVPNFISLDFLLAVKDTLENLEIDFWLHLGKEEYLKMADKLAKSGQVLKLLYCSDKLVESNVWGLLTKLRRLQVKELNPAGRHLTYTRVCTRSDWNQQIGYLNMLQPDKGKKIGRRSCMWFNWRGLFGG